MVPKALHSTEVVHTLFHHEELYRIYAHFQSRHRRLHLTRDRASHYCNPWFSQDAFCGNTLIRPLDEVMANHIQKALDQANGKVEGNNGAASMLGINPGTLQGRMKKLKISYGRNSNKKR